MRLYQVCVPLESGYYLNLMVTAPDDVAAKRDAFRVLGTVAKPESWHADDATAHVIELAATGEQERPAMTDEAAARELDRAERLFASIDQWDGRKAAIRAVLTMAHARR